MSKPHIYGEYEKKDTRHWHYDRPLFSKWKVWWVEPPACRHEYCGEEMMEKEFATWVDAIAFANTL